MWTCSVVCLVLLRQVVAVRGVPARPVGWEELDQCRPVLTGCSVHARLLVSSRSPTG